MSMATNFAAKLLQVKMYGKFFSRLCLLIIALQLVVIVGYNGFLNPLWEPTKTMLANGFSISWGMFKALHFRLGADVLIHTLGGFWDVQKDICWKSFICWVILPMVMIYALLFDDDKSDNREYIQGRKYITPDELNDVAHTKKWYKKFFKFIKCIPLGKVFLPFGDENKQTFAVGKPGCGKTNTFNQIILKILKLKRKAIIHDYKGDYVEKFYDPTRDKIFNPLDSRTLGWCLFNDCKSVMDIEAFAAALISNSSTGDPFWNNAARDIFIGVLRYCFANNKKTNNDIWETITLPNSILYVLLRQTKGGEAGAKHLEDSDGRTAMSIMSNLMQFVKIFEYMKSMHGTFSIKEWIADENERGLLFITNYANLQNTLRPIISLFIQTAGSALLSLTDDIHRRVYFFLDEFGQLPNMSTIQNLMTASRSKGGAVFIGIQDIGQLDTIYKKDIRTTILNSASNRLIFNCKDHDTAKFFSNDIGETEYWEDMESQSIGFSKGDRVNTSRQRRKEALVTPEDIQSLPDLNAFISIGHHNVTLTKWKYKKLKKVANAFMQRPDLDLEDIIDVTPFDLAESDPTPDESKTQIEVLEVASLVPSDTELNVPSDKKSLQTETTIPANADKSNLNGKPLVVLPELAKLDGMVGDDVDAEDAFLAELSNTDEDWLV